MNNYSYLIKINKMEMIKKCLVEIEQDLLEEDQ